MAVAIISIAQQASPKATGQSDDRRDQLTIPSTVDSMMFCLRDSSTDSAALSVTLINSSGMLTRLGRRWGLGGQELTQDSHKLSGLVLRDKGVAVGDLGEPPAWERFRQPSSVLRRHHAVLGGPHDEDRTVEGAYSFGGVDEIAPPGGVQVLLEIAPDGAVRKRGAQPGAHYVIRDRPLAHPAQDDGQAAQRPQAKWLQRGIQPTGQLRGQLDHAPG